jgi:hypothetical protein
MPTLPVWQGNTFELALKAWLMGRRQKDFWALPFIIAWGIWITRNGHIFQDENSSAVRIAVQSLGIYNSFSSSGEGTVACPREVREETPDISIPWAYFDGASLLINETVGGVACLYLSHSHYFFLKEGLGADTNNYSELLALKLLLLFAREKGCRALQVFGIL